MLIKTSVCDGPCVQAGEREAEAGRTAEVAATATGAGNFNYNSEEVGAEEAQQ